MKRILGLDLGTNSIGWSVITQTLINENWAVKEILGTNSRIIPMDQASISDFEKGNLQSQTAERTRLRGVRRLIQRSLLRRERLHRVLNILGFLPQHYADQIDFEKKIGQFREEETLLPYVKDQSTGKYRFLFIDSFNEMLQDFSLNQPDLVSNNKKIPHNWTLYYLRKKALTFQISKEELAWIILNFNQKRGYYEQRGEDDDITQQKEYNELEVLKVVDTGEVKNGSTWYEIHLSDGGLYKRQSKTPLDWVGKTKEFIITYKVDKAGNESASYSIPSKEDDWTLVKKRTEKLIDNSGLTVGTYIYDWLLKEPEKKIKGGLIQTIERKRYKEELLAILEKQKEFHTELKNRELYKQSIEELYRSNIAHRSNIADKDFTYLIVSDILFYHRPLKSQKHLIDHCQYENRYYRVKDTNELKEIGVKCIHKAHPLFEEFRLWQLIQNLKIQDALGNDISEKYLGTEEQIVGLFERLRERKEINQKQFLAIFKLKEEDAKWNYGDTVLTLGLVRCDILARIKKSKVETVLSEEQIILLWHILYSVTDRFELEVALKSFATKCDIDNVEAFVEELRKIKPFDSSYASYSEKAIKKLLPLMRMGKYWNENDIQLKIRERIERIIDGVEDESINTRTREQLNDFVRVSDFRGLKLHQACYAVYGRYSEAKKLRKWTSPSDIDNYLKNFKQHSLRNPVVEQMVRETLKTVHNIWTTYGDISEIHIELGREMKSPKNVRERMSKQNQENEQTNIRIRELLKELHNEDSSIRPESPAQQERLKLYEEGIVGSVDKIPEEIDKIRRQRTPSRNDITRYKCWLEQGYASPYTGRIIPLNKLFSYEYEIEHIIPQARYFDDSLTNKVICESEVNKCKGHQLGYEFISSNQNKSITIGGEEVSLFSPEEYEDFVKRNFKNSPIKRKKLMLEDIPESFIERQMNDTRYISKMICGMLSNIVRDENDQEAISKNVITVTGGITAKLKQDWGINDVWNNIIKDRFIRLNELTNSTDFGRSVDNKFRVSVPDELSSGFSKKRIDHRHHAMDAIVIACATRSHINLLNNQSSKDKENRYDLRSKLCGGQKINGKWTLKPPYKGFNQDVEQILKNTIVSIKSNTRVITQSTNTYQKFVDGEKKWVKQDKGDNMAIRKPLHKDTVFGLVNLQQKKTVGLSVALDNIKSMVDKILRKKVQELCNEQFTKKQILAYFKALGNSYNGVNTLKVEVYYYTNDEGSTQMVAVRKLLDGTFDKKKIESITDSGIRRILHKHLALFDNKPEEAFSADGLDVLNKKDGYIQQLNNGKLHKPIKSVRLSEIKGLKFNVGIEGNKQQKYVEAAKGTNLFYAVYENKDIKRSYESVPLNVVIENLKEGLPPAPQVNDKGDKLLFVLSPNDFVYLPTEEQLINGNILLSDVETNKGRIYKFVSCTSNRSSFVPCNIAYRIIQDFDSTKESGAGKLELGANNKSERAWTGEMIKEICIPIKIDRLGNISLS